MLTVNCILNDCVWNTLSRVPTSAETVNYMSSDTWTAFIFLTLQLTLQLLSALKANSCFPHQIQYLWHTFFSMPRSMRVVDAQKFVSAQTFHNSRPRLRMCQASKLDAHFILWRYELFISTSLTLLLCSGYTMLFYLFYVAQLKRGRSSSSCCRYCPELVSCFLLLMSGTCQYARRYCKYMSISGWAVTMIWP